MNIFTKSLTVGAVLVIGALSLSACGNAEGASGKNVVSPSAEASEPPLIAEVESDISQTNDTLVELDEVPDWADQAFMFAPAGEWIYSGDDSQFRAVSNDLDTDAIAGYVEALNANGWLGGEEGENGGYLLTSLDESQFLEIQETTVVGEQGEALSGTVITITRNH